VKADFRSENLTFRNQLLEFNHTESVQTHDALAMKMIPVLTLVVFVCLSAPAENWAQWRGPSFNGSTTEQNLPAQWSKTENVAWVAPLPGYSGATPIVWENSVFVSSPDEQKNLNLLCVDRTTGQVRWERKVATGDFEKGRNNTASPSPVSDGKAVFILFATGDLAAFDFSGKEIWHRNVAADYGRFAINWIYGSSPLLYRGKLYVQVFNSAKRNTPTPRMANLTASHFCSVWTRLTARTSGGRFARPTRSARRRRPIQHPFLLRMGMARKLLLWAETM